MGRPGRGLWLAVVCALTSACAARAAAPPPAPPSSPSPLVGRELPTFRRQSVTGEVVDTAALRGKVVVVKFFARPCAPCGRSLPTLEAWHREHPEVVVLGLAVDEELQDALDQVA